MFEESDFGGGAEGTESGAGVMEDVGGVDGAGCDGAEGVGDEGGDFEGFFAEWVFLS